MDNLAIWNKLNQPPTWALKEIKAGRLKGKSDINPQWRYYALTDTFGPCGTGWKFTIDKLWTEPGNGNEVFAFALITLYVNNGGQWSAPIPGAGGSKLVQQESGGPHNNDEGYKMAITDALSTSCKMLGVASDVYMGLWDGSKYINRDIGPQKPSPPKAAPASLPHKQPPCTPTTINQPKDEMKTGVAAMSNSEVDNDVQQVQESPVWAEALQACGMSNTPAGFTAKRQVLAKYYELCRGPKKAA